jgi:hypothetical protein
VIVFVAPDVQRTAGYYRDMLDFRVVEHFDKEEKFAALYRDEIEIVVVQAQFGYVTSNRERYGAGYDAYIDPEDLEAVDALYWEWKEKGVTMVNPPVFTPYGCYEFVFEDIDGRRIGIGRIKHNQLFSGV